MKSGLVPGIAANRGAPDAVERRRVTCERSSCELQESSLRREGSIGRMEHSEIRRLRGCPSGSVRQSVGATRFRAEIAPPVSPA